MSFFYNTAQFRQSLIGLVHETVKDPGERDNLIVLIGQYGDARFEEGVEEVNTAYSKVISEVRSKYV